jgi:hypothetical protein
VPFQNDNVVVKVKREKSMSSNERLLRLLSKIPFVLMILFSMIVLILVACADEKTPSSDKRAVNVDPGKLVGNWLRPDGGYVIEILDVHDQGTLNARYLNPQPINIARAEWKSEDNRLKIFILFDDVNYPGSTYTLDYFPDRDQLIGAYFQAVQQQSYYVEFIRQPSR